MELNSQENFEKNGIQWEKCMEQNRFSSLEMFFRNTCDPSSPCCCATYPESRDEGHRQNPAIISILEIILCAELTIAHRLM